MVGIGLPGKKPTRCLLNRARSLALGTQPANGRYIPKCTDVGKYDPVQCHPALGQCWCVDKYGNELYGTRQEGTPDCNNVGKIVKDILLLYVLHPKKHLGYAVIINTFLKNYHRKGTLEHFVLFEAVIYLLYYNFIFGLHFRLFFYSFKVVIVHRNTSHKIEPQHIDRLRRNLVGMCTFFQHS